MPRRQHDCLAALKQPLGGELSSHKIPGKKSVARWVIHFLLHSLDLVVTQIESRFRCLGFGGIFLHPMAGHIAAKNRWNPNHLLVVL
jgi:hypothetical protein